MALQKIFLTEGFAVHENLVFRDGSIESKANAADDSDEMFGNLSVGSTSRNIHRLHWPTIVIQELSRPVTGVKPKKAIHILLIFDALFILRHLAFSL